MAVMMLLAIVSFAPGLCAEDGNGGSAATPVEASPPAGNPSNIETAALKAQVARQQARIDQLERTLNAVLRRLDQLDPERASNPAPSEPAQLASSAPMLPAAAVKRDETAKLSPPMAPPTDSGIVMKPATAAAAPAMTAAVRSQSDAAKPKSSPLSIPIGNAEFTPGGFMDFTNVFRSTNTGSATATSFGTIPYSVIGGTPNAAGRMSEYRALAQNSRISMKITSEVSGFNVAGYIEGDFAGNNPSSLFVTSNSSTFRLRHYLVQFSRGKFEMVGGQTWSLMTPGRTGISPWSTDIFISQVQDANYQLGITWGRQSQLRLVYHPNKEWAMAFSVENPNQYLSAGVVLPSTTFNGQFDVAGNQVTTPNLHPDMLAKVAYDPVVNGKHMHAELGGIVRSFRVFNPAANTSSATTGGGVTAGLNLEVMKNFHFIVNGFYDDGGGRYILGLGPDVIVKPDGTLSAVHSGSGVAGFEYQFNPKILLFSYYGSAYFQRNTGYTLVDGRPVWVGFGAPVSGATAATTELAANRAVQEPTFGFARTIWKNPKLGTLLWVNQYSYLTRDPWVVPAGTAKNAHLGMAFTDLRYILP